MSPFPVFYEEAHSSYANRTETYWNGRNWRPILKLKTVEDACKTNLLSIRGKVNSKARSGKMREWVCWVRDKNGEK